MVLAPTLPSFLVSPIDILPQTSEQNTKGTTSICIARTNPLPITLKTPLIIKSSLMYPLGNWYKIIPVMAPRIKHIKIFAVKFNFFLISIPLYFYQMQFLKTELAKYKYIYTIKRRK